MRVGMAVVIFLGLRIRVGEEEKILRKELGKEWEEYNTRTARYVPFLF